jgi:hypothetical protein
MGLLINDASDAFRDKDGDRVPNLWEYARGTAANNASSTPSFDAVVDYTQADDPAQSRYQTLQAAYDSLSSSVPGYRFLVQIRRGTYAADLDATTTLKSVAWIGQKGKTSDTGTVESNWATQRARGHEGVLLDGTLAQGAGLRFGDETVLDGVIIGNWLSNHAPYANIVSSEPIWQNQRAAITVVAPPSSSSPPEVRIVNCIIRNWMPVFLADVAAPQPLAGAVSNQGGDLWLVHCSIVRSLSSSAIGYTGVPNNAGQYTYSVNAYRSVLNESGQLRVINTVIWDPDNPTATPGIEGANVSLTTSAVYNFPNVGNIISSLGPTATKGKFPNITLGGYESNYARYTSSDRPLYNTGTSVGVLWDIHGEARTTTANTIDIGADEWVNTTGTGESAVDNLPDWWEFTWFGSRSPIETEDADSDNLDQLTEYFEGTSPTADQDGDGLLDTWELRYWVHLGAPGSAPGDNPDSDVFTNLQEYNNSPPTNPLVFNNNDDLDNDGLSDEWEILYFHDLTATPTQNPDDDLANNLEEQTLGTNPTVADVLFLDTDLDGWEDSVELTWFSDLSQTQLDDFDGDGLSNLLEITRYGTDPRLADSNGDGVNDDIAAIVTTATNALDFDGDGVTNTAEIALGTNLYLADTDGDGLSDLVDPLPLDGTPAGTAIALPGPPQLTLITPASASPVGP